MLVLSAGKPNLRLKGKTRYTLSWLGLLAYLFVCLAHSQMAMILSSALAGPHEVAIVADGNHEDIVFTHEQMKAHHHVHTHGQDQHHVNGEDDIRLLFDTHHASHPDHVVHLAEHHEQINAQVPRLQFGLQYLHHIAMPTEVMTAIDSFLKTVLFQVLPQPPPIRPPVHKVLSTVKLML